MNRGPGTNREPAVGRRGQGELVPPAELRTYYGQPVIKQPTWKSPDVPVYFFLGGLAGVSSTMAVFAEATGRPQLARAGYLTAALGAAGGTGFLINDLGRPERFLNMLRVFKPTSPLSVGSWALAAFGTLAGAAAASAVTGWLPGPGAVAKAGAALLGPVIMTYPAVLVADTAVPAWHEAYRELPFVFAGSSLLSGGGIGLVAAPVRQAGPARVLAVAGAGLASTAERRINTRLGPLAEPYHRGQGGTWLRLGRVLSVAGAVGALASRRSRLLGAVSGAALLAGSLCTRFGIFEAGKASANDPAYTVRPQRERLDRAKEAG